MPNTYFQFKQFTIQQEHSAMKVCTDACLFGAWTAEKLDSSEWQPRQILDIGTGTGLLALMLAQKSSANIDAVELDEEAVVDARANFMQSPWKERIQLIHTDARILPAGKKYGLIIANPPFFENDLRSVDTRRNLAMHSASLRLEELFLVIKTMLADDGRVALMLPYHRKDECIQLAARHTFTPAEEIWVRQTTGHPYFRVMFLFSKTIMPARQMEINIRENGEYTPRFIQLLKDYYLYL